MNKHKHSAIFYCILFLFSVGLTIWTSSPTQVSAAQKATGARIHFINLDENCDAILLECNGAFGMVDSGEDNSYPNGSDFRYPLRSGITKGHGVEKEVIAYLKSLGVERLDFYIGTHPHSDHIGNAYKIIKEFKPKRVYLRSYKDSYITDSAHLWDNRYVYDKTIQAIKEVNKKAKSAEEGITLIQTMSPNAKYVDPVRKLKKSSGTAASKKATSSPQKGKNYFTLGDGMTIKIMNYNATLKAPDANYFCLGVKVSANGSTAFLAGDINNYDGTEDRMAKQLGRVDVLKLGHHGYDGSNSTAYLKKLKPKYAIVMGTTNHCPQSMFNTLLSMGSKVYATPLYVSSAPATIITMKSTVSINLKSEKNLSGKVVAAYSNELKRYVLYKNGKTYKKSGWVTANGRRYYISSATKRPITEQWRRIKGEYYYFRSTGTVATGWFQLDGTWYYSDKQGIMSTGWKTIHGLKYYFIPNGTKAGSMVTGDRKINGYWYYFRSNGSMFTGWLNNKYYYDDNGRYIKNRNKTGWQTTSQGTWWRYKNGKYPRRTWKTISGKRYYFNASGYRVIGLKTLQGKKYYFNNKGVLQTKQLQKVNGHLYYLGNNGAAVKGWLKYGGNWYYFNSLYRGVSGSQTLKDPVSKKTCYYYFHTQNHKMQTGWVQVNNNWRYFFTTADVKRLGNVILGNMARGGRFTIPNRTNTSQMITYIFDAQGAASQETTPAPTVTPEPTITETPEPTQTPEDTQGQEAVEISSEDQTKIPDELARENPSPESMQAPEEIQESTQVPDDTLSQESTIILEENLQ